MDQEIKAGISNYSEDRDLPLGWACIPICRVSSIVTGNTPPRAQSANYGSTYPWVKPPDLDRQGPILKTLEYLSEQGASIARLLPVNAVLVSCIGNLGKVGLAGTTLATNQQINAVVFDPSLVIPEYGFYYCRTLKNWME